MTKYEYHSPTGSTPGSVNALRVTGLPTAKRSDNPAECDRMTQMTSQLLSVSKETLDAAVAADKAARSV